jgi:hypothetical protein
MTHLASEMHSTVTRRNGILCARKLLRTQLLTFVCSTTPTVNDILVPETLQKKRVAADRASDKAVELRHKRKQVCPPLHLRG